MTRLLIGLVSVLSTAAAASLPLHFEPNRGQAAIRVSSICPAATESPLTWRGNQAAFSVGGASVVMSLVNARPGRAEAADRLPGTSSYFQNRERSRWNTRIPHYGKVVYRDVYPGIDLVYHGAAGHLEYDFRVRPGADPGAVRIAYEGATGLRLEHGDLLISTAEGAIRQRRPVVYQSVGGSRRPGSSYVPVGWAPGGLPRVGLRPDASAHHRSRHRICHLLRRPAGWTVPTPSR